MVLGVSANALTVSFLIPHSFAEVVILTARLVVAPLPIANHAYRVVLTPISRETNVSEDATMVSHQSILFASNAYLHVLLA
jgi:hypothetical protein